MRRVVVEAEVLVTLERDYHEIHTTFCEDCSRTLCDDSFETRENKCVDCLQRLSARCEMQVKAA